MPKSRALVSNFDQNLILTLNMFSIYGPLAVTHEGLIYACRISIKSNRTFSFKKIDTISIAFTFAVLIVLGVMEWTATA